MMKKTDVIIIGAGIGGITSSIYLKRGNIKFVLLEASDIGGKLNMLREIENYPGFTNSSGKEIIKSLKKQMDSLDIDVTYSSVQTIIKDPNGFKVITDNESYITKTVIVACGTSPSFETIMNEKDYVGKGVSYCVICDGFFFRNKDVCVYGNNNSALEDALYLTNIVKKLYFICPNELLSGDKELINNLKRSNNVQIIEGKLISKIIGDDFRINKILLDNDEEISIDGLFPFIGDKNAQTFLNNIKPTFDGNFIKVNEYMETDIEGLYAIGDIANRPLKQLVSAASDGAIAAIQVIKYLKRIDK